MGYNKVVPVDLSIEMAAEREGKNSVVLQASIVIWNLQHTAGAKLIDRGNALIQGLQISDGDSIKMSSEKVTGAALSCVCVISGFSKPVI
jgi:hypothetical protein